MKTINEEVRREIVVDKSRFIAVLMRVDNVDLVNDILKNLRTEYRGARHYCYAYIVDEKMRFSDDGEPSGTAGKPLLNLLEKNELNHVLIVVVRYFGGVLLGAGRLLRTYVNAGIEAINNATIIEVEPLFSYVFCIKEPDLADFYNFINIMQIPYEMDFKDGDITIKINGNDELESKLREHFYNVAITKTRIN